MSLDVQFSAKEMSFIEWKATPRADREPPTQALLAVEIGRNIKTLSRWFKRPEIREAIIARARELLGDDLPEIYGSLRAEAIDGSFQHQKLALELTGEYVQKSEVEATHTMSGDVLDAITGSLKRGYEHDLPNEQLPGDLVE